MALDEIEAKRAYSALLGARAIAEARGWMDIVEDINKVFKAAEESDGEERSGEDSDSEAYESCKKILEHEKEPVRN